MRAPLLLAACTIISWVNAINWQPENWALGCDFGGNDFMRASTRLEDCGTFCSQVAGCTHFTWSIGNCWLKRGNVNKGDATDTGNQNHVCGVVRELRGNVLATRHVNGGGDTCALPQANYDVTNPFALGNIAELGDLGFKPELCGHVFRIDCDHGALDVVVTKSNLGGGLDLYSESSWPKATGNAPPGETRCFIRLSDRNPLSGGSFQCYYKPGTDANNPILRIIGIFNTGSKVVTGATLEGKSGSRVGSNPYYAFSGRSIDVDEEVVFSFDDGSTRPVKLRDCKTVRSEQLWK